jgi:hypothetical protein
MRFKSMTLALLFVLMLAVAPALAQSEQWSVVLINTTTSDLLRVYADGTTETYDLDLPDYTLNRLSMSVSADGNLFAYCQGDYTVQEKPTFAVNIYDLRTRTLIVEYDLGAGLNCNLGPYAFSPDATSLSLALLNYFNGDPNADTTRPIWEILNLDVATGTVLHRLNEQSPEVQAVFNPVERWTLMPYIQDVTANTVSFALVMWATDASPSQALTWDFAANTVTAAPEWEDFGASTLVTPAGVTSASVGLDDSLPAGEAGGPIPSTNRVQVTEPGADPVTVYINTEDLPVTTEFINNGNSLAIQVLQGFDMTQPDVMQGNYWLALNRDGSLTTLTEPITNFNVLTAAPDGFVLLVAISDLATNITHFQLDYTTDGTTTNLWNNAGDTSNHFWEIAWVTPSTISEDLPPFTPAS